MNNRKFHNLNLLDIPNCDFYPMASADMPLPLNFKLVPFDRAHSIPKIERSRYIVHFYIDDFLFERFWVSPDKYIPMLRDFGAVVAPDFSIYYDSPIPVSYYNKFRNHWLSYYMRLNGCYVIPNWRLACPDFYPFTSIGYPDGGIFFASAVGVTKNPKHFLDFCESLLVLESHSPNLVYIIIRSDDDKINYINNLMLTYSYKFIKLERR